MPESETVNVVTASTLTAVDTPVSAPNPSSSEDIKQQLTPKPESPLPKEQDNGPKNKSPQQKPDTRSSDEIRKQLASIRDGKSSESADQNGSKKDATSEPERQTQAGQVEDKSKWFDPERGFKTAEDMKKSYAELQNTFRQKSEEIKLEKLKLEIEQGKIREEAEKIKNIKAQRKLTPEETAKQEAISKWESENKEALDLIEAKIAERLESKKMEEKKQEFNSSIEQQILKERNEWLDSFNKDEGRKKLWPVMEQVFREKGDNQDSVIKDFAKNPLPYIEAMALHRNFSTIAEQIKAEAIQQYQQKQKEAAEVERKTKFALPGGPKTGTGDVDISKLSSAEIGSLLTRNENG